MVSKIGNDCKRRIYWKRSRAAGYGGGKAIRNFPAKSADRQGNNRKMINQVRCCFLSAVSGGNVGTDGSGNVADRHGLQPYSTGAGKYSVE